VLWFWLLRFKQSRIDQGHATRGEREQETQQEQEQQYNLPTWWMRQRCSMFQYRSADGSKNTRASPSLWPNTNILLQTITLLHYSI